MAPSTQDLPIREPQPSSDSTQDQPTSTDGNIDLLPHLSTWLDSAHPKISAFWIGATWRAWARYEIYLYLEQLLSSTHLIYHTFNDIWGTEDIDIFMEPLNSDFKNIAIVLRCERVNENAGSYEQFRAEMDGDIERIKDLRKVDGMYEGTRLLVVGLSGPFPGENEDTEWKCRPEPRHFEAGEVNGWIYEMELEGKDDMPQLSG